MMWLRDAPTRARLAPAAWAPVLLALTFAYLLFGAGSCERDARPELLKVVDITPREAEVGDRIALLGEGFPAGRAAHVVFQGTLHRPGERSVRDAEITATGTVVGPEQVVLAFDEATEARFCGAGDRATHTTFEGDVVVSFPAATPGAPPVTGSLRHVLFDVRPSAGPADAERDREGQRVLSFVGVHAAQSASGLVVQGVDPGSRAEATQIESGDVLATFDGVRVASAGDLIPPVAEREATVGVRHAGSETELPRTLVVEGFRRAPPTDLLAAALIVLVALLAVLLFAAPTPAGLSASIQRVVLRVRARALRRTSARLSPWETLWVVLVSVARECVPSSVLPALVDALVCSVFAVLPFGQYLVASQLDVGLLFVAAATSLAASALLASGTPLRGIQAAAYVLWQHVPAAAAVATVVLTTGSLRVQEVERAQGGWPWDWLAFRHPAALVALVFLLASGSVAFSEPPARGISALVEDDHSASLARHGIWLEIACRAHRLIVAGLASVLFLGGWLLPGVPSATQDARPWLELLGAGVLLAKTGVIVLMLAAADAFGARLPLVAHARETLLLRVPVALLALGTAAAWSWWGPGGAGQTLVSCGLVAAVALTALAVAQRLKQGVGAPEARLSPFL